MDLMENNLTQWITTLNERIFFVDFFFVHFEWSRDTKVVVIKCVRAGAADSICWCHLSLCWLFTGLKDSKSRKIWCDSNVYDFIFILLFLYYRLLLMLMLLLLLLRRCFMPLLVGGCACFFALERSSSLLFATFAFLCYLFFAVAVLWHRTFI